MSNFVAGFGITGASFEISSYSQITITDGADPTVVDGDNVANETPNDPTQTYLGNAIFWDYTIEVSDGTNTYQIALIDYDIDGDGTSGGTNAEDGFFLAFVGGSFPPLDTTLTIQSIVDNSASLDVDTLVPCFVAGTMIETGRGHRPIETLSVGDDVVTLDKGPQPIRWIGSRTLSSGELAQKPRLRPIRIAAGALGNGLPARELRVSPQHRMLVRSPIVERMFGEVEVFIPAVKLLALPGVSVDDGAEPVTYLHVLLDNHEVIFAEGTPSESLFSGPIALESVGPDAFEEIAALFPEIVSPGFEPSLARPVPETGKQMRNLVRRHAKNRKPLVA